MSEARQFLSDAPLLGFGAGLRASRAPRLPPRAGPLPYSKSLAAFSAAISSSLRRRLLAQVTLMSSGCST